MAAADAVEALTAEATEARRELLSTLPAGPPEALTAPGLVGEWSARELIAHLGYWAGHAADAIQHVELGRAADFAVGDDQVEERNRIVARVARDTPLEVVRAREQASFEAFVARLERLDPALLAARLADSGTLEEGIREDVARHYRSHALDLKARATPPPGAP